MTIETKQKQILECNYKEGDVSLSLKFDKEKPNHLEDIGRMIKMLSTCRDDLAKYLEESKC